MVFAGLTVVIALVGLSVVQHPDADEMGIAAAGTVALAVLIALTLIPACSATPAAGSAPPAMKSRLLGGGRAAKRPQRPNMGTAGRASSYAVAGVLLLGVVGLRRRGRPAASLELGLPTTARSRRPPPAPRLRLLSEGFGPGSRPLVSWSTPRAATIRRPSSSGPPTTSRASTTS
ncbi:hypothetical protein GCM10023238_15100 [Streptomyces heliomycini]